MMEDLQAGSLYLLKECDFPNWEDRLGMYYSRLKEAPNWMLMSDEEET